MPSSDTPYIPGGPREADAFLVKRSWQPTIWALILFVVFELVAWNVVQRQYQATVNDHLDLATQELTTKIQERITAYHQILRGGAALFAASEQVSRDEWRTYVQKLNLDEGYPGILGVGFAKAVAPDQIEDHNASIRTEGFNGYALWPQGERAEYSAIIYLEPFNWRNQRAFGYDMLSEPTRHEAMMRARDSGDSALSGRITLVQETNQNPQPGVLLYVPLYRQDTIVQTVEQRRAALLGWVYSPYRTHDLVQGILGRFSEQIRLRIYDGRSHNQSDLLFDSQPQLGNTHNQQELDYHVHDELTLAGRIWTVDYYPLPGYETSLEIPTPAWQMGIFTVVGSLFVIFAWIFSNTRYQAHLMAMNLTESLRNSEQKYRQLVNISREGIISLDRYGNLKFANPKFTSMTGFASEELIGMPFNRLLDDQWLPQFTEHLKHSENGISETFEIEIQREAGHSFTAVYSAVPNYDAKGAFDGEVAVILDITERKLAEEAIRHQATHDPLTGLPNRALFEDRIQQAIGQAQRHQRLMAVLFIDLDHFKRVNDSLGHLLGDRLLVEASSRMHRVLRESDTLMRPGGDEFVLLLPEIDKERDAIDVAEKIHHVLDQHFTLQGHIVVVTASIGISYFPEDGFDTRELLEHADSAMYHAKFEGRNCHRTYDPEWHPPAGKTPSGGRTPFPPNEEEQPVSVASNDDSASA